MAKALRKRASKQSYVPISQLRIEGFSTPFEQQLDPTNRWVVLSSKIPWDLLVGIYNRGMRNKSTGAQGINPRVVVGALIIKHMESWSDRDTLQHIQENMYLQFFLGFSSFVKESIFDPSCFVDFRKRMDLNTFEEFNTAIVKLALLKEEEHQPEKKSHNGRMITDATACPQDITYPTDIKVLNSCIVKSELLIDKLYNKTLHKNKPRTNRKKLRKAFLTIAQNKNPSKKKINKAIKEHLTALRNNIKSINSLLDKNSEGLMLLKRKEYKYLLVIQTVYEQQKGMYDGKTHKCPDRIVSIHQPHVRPIVRGKLSSKVEFGSKIQVTLMNGFAFLDEFSWDAFNEGKYLISSVEKYKERFGYYPETVLADKIYCNRANRNDLKELKITLRAKPLGRPKAGEKNSVSPGERNPIEGKFGQAKTKYGLNRIMARLDITSKSWVACIILVLNLVKLAGGSTLLLIKSKLFIPKINKKVNLHINFEQKWAA